MTERRTTENTDFRLRVRWFFVSGSIAAAAVAVAAEGTGQWLGAALVGVSVLTIISWSVFEKPSVSVVAAVVAVSMLTLGWTVEEPESALFQSVLITTAVGWRINRLAHSMAFMVALALIPLLGTMGPNNADWGWWNWSVGTLLTWGIGRVLRLLEQTLNELVDARSQLIGNAARAERLRISRDVHDLVGHSLTAMLLNIRAAQRALDNDSETTRSALADAEQIGTTGLADIRTALTDLTDESVDVNPSSQTLASLPDGEAILQLLDQQRHIAIEIQGDIALLHGQLAVSLYRILQECITNISKYAAAESGSISLTRSAGHIVLKSCNAIQPGLQHSSTRSAISIGLISMRERTTNLGGTFSCGEEAGQWTLICRIPYA